MKLALGFIFLNLLALSARGCEGWEFGSLASDHRPVAVRRFDPACPLGVSGTPDRVERARARLEGYHSSLIRAEADPRAANPFTLALSHPEVRARWKAQGLKVGTLGASSDGRWLPSKYDEKSGKLRFNVAFLRTDPDQEFVGALSRASFQRAIDGQKLVEVIRAQNVLPKTNPEQIAVFFLERAALDDECRFYDWARGRNDLVKRDFMEKMTTGDAARQARARRRYLIETFGLDRRLVERLWDIAIPREATKPRLDP